MDPEAAGRNCWKRDRSTSGTRDSSSCRSTSPIQDWKCRTWRKVAGKSNRCCPRSSRTEKQCSAGVSLFFIPRTTFLKWGSKVGSRKLHVIDTTIIIIHVTITEGILRRLLNEPVLLSKFTSIRKSNKKKTQTKCIKCFLFVVGRSGGKRSQLTFAGRQKKKIERRYQYYNYSQHVERQAKASNLPGKIFLLINCFVFVSLQPAYYFFFCVFFDLDTYRKKKSADCGSGAQSQSDERLQDTLI